MVIQVEAIFALVMLGLFQAGMQGMMFYDSLAFLDKYLPFGIKWFSKDTGNKSNWTMKIFGKPIKVFKWFPFIMFCDVFHFFHGLFGMWVGNLVAALYGFGDNPITILIFVASAFIYSTVFHFQLILMKRLKNGI